MIHHLRGLLVEKQAPSLVVEVGGLGYNILAPLTTFYALDQIGSEVFLFTHFHVREDAQTLYGFGDRASRALFRALLKVSGVGPKMALAILSSMSVDEFLSCMHHQELKRLTKIPGVGAKTAARLLVEMKDRIDQITPESRVAFVAASSTHQPSMYDEAVSALEALGYKPNEADRLVKNISAPYASSEDLIRLALQSAVR